jgi:uncharacterized protein YkwD
LLAVGASALALAPAARAQDDCPNAGLRPERQDIAAFDHAVVCLINLERVNRGRQRLQRDARLALAADRHSADMVGREYFSHFTPAGADVVDRLQRVGYVPGERMWLVGEVLAWGILWRSTPRATVDAWLDSPPHRRALFEPGFRQIGAGAVVGNPVRHDVPGVTVAVELGRVG